MSSIRIRLSIKNGSESDLREHMDPDPTFKKIQDRHQILEGFLNLNISTGCPNIFRNPDPDLTKSPGSGSATLLAAQAYIYKFEVILVEMQLYSIPLLVLSTLFH